MSETLHRIENKPINFIRYNYNIGDKVVLNFNACNESCKCYYTKNKDKTNCLEIDKEYKIIGKSYFGGGCPGEFLRLDSVPSTHEDPNDIWNMGIPANWFKPI